MRVVKLCEAAQRIEARRRLVRVTPALPPRATQGRARMPARRRLLRTIADEARRQGRPPPFGGDGGAV
jgi:hypothetical protein